MIKLDEIGENALEKALDEIKQNRENPSLRKTNNTPEELMQCKRGGKTDADQS